MFQKCNSKQKDQTFIKIGENKLNMEKERKDVIVSFRIPEYLKSEMEKIDINWSEFLREKVEEKIKLERMKNVWSEIEAIRDLIQR